MPSAIPLLVPLLQSPRWYEVRNAADLLGRLLSPAALAPLKGLLAHADPRVRAAALEALSRYPGSAAVDAFRQGLTHAAPATRSDAARAIGRRGSGAFAMPLVAALEEERDPKTWSEMLRALARMDSPDALSAVVNIALRKKSVLRRGGYPVPQRLEAVAVLAEAGTEGARHALIRIAQEAEGEVGQAARTQLTRLGGYAGKRGRPRLPASPPSRLHLVNLELLHVHAEIVIDAQPGDPLAVHARRGRGMNFLPVDHE
jgi:HEAT repeat protein